MFIHHFNLIKSNFIQTFDKICSFSVHNSWKCQEKNCRSIFLLFRWGNHKNKQDVDLHKKPQQPKGFMAQNTNPTEFQLIHEFSGFGSDFRTSDMKIYIKCIQLRKNGFIFWRMEPFGFYGSRKSEENRSAVYLLTISIIYRSLCLEYLP